MSCLRIRNQTAIFPLLLNLDEMGASIQLFSDRNKGIGASVSEFLSADVFATFRCRLPAHCSTFVVWSLYTNLLIESIVLIDSL